MTSNIRKKKSILISPESDAQLTALAKFYAKTKKEVFEILIDLAYTDNLRMLIQSKVVKE